MKKICLIILFLAMIFPIPAAVLAVEGADVEVSVETVEGQNGDEVELAIRVDTEKKIQGAVFYLDFDESQLELLEAYSAEKEDNAIFTINVNNKMVGYIRLNPKVLSNVVLVYARFKVLSVDPDRTAAVSIRDAEFGDENEHPLSVSVNAGGVKSFAVPAPESSADQSQPAASESQGSQPAENSEVQSQPAASTSQGNQPVESNAGQSTPAASESQGSQPAENSEAQSQPSASASQESQSAESSEVQSRPYASDSQENQSAESSEVQSQTAASDSQESQISEQASEENHSATAPIGESTLATEPVKEKTTAVVPPASAPSPPSDGGSGNWLLIGGISLLILGGAFLLGKKALGK